MNTVGNRLVKVGNVMGFGKKWATPSSVHLCKSAGEFDEVITITGKCRSRSSALILSKTDIPLINGSFKSRNTTTKDSAFQHFCRSDD